jgi:hypothetical protein
LSNPSANVSLMPATHLFTVLNVAGATVMASAGGNGSGSSGARCSSRTACPVGSATAALSIQCGYILRFLDTDAGRTEPISPEDERALVERASRAIDTLRARADRREHV